MALEKVKTVFPKGMVVGFDEHRASKGLGAGVDATHCRVQLAYDLWHLSRAKLIIGSPSSTFGMLAAGLDEMAPLVFPAGCNGELTTARLPNAVVESQDSRNDALAEFTARVFCTNSQVYSTSPSKLRSCGDHQAARARSNVTISDNYQAGGLVAKMKKVRAEPLIVGDTPPSHVPVVSTGARAKSPSASLVLQRRHQHHHSQARKNQNQNQGNGKAKNPRM